MSNSMGNRWSNDCKKIILKIDGSIKIDGKEKDDYTEMQWYSMFTMIYQATVLLNDTILNNITLYKDYTKDEVEHVIQTTNLEEVIQKLPDGLDTIVEENGKNFQGEKDNVWQLQEH